MANELDAAVCALATQMSASLLAMSQDGATDDLALHAESLLERASDLATAVTDPRVPQTYTGWSPADPSIPDFPPPNLL